MVLIALSFVDVLRPRLPRCDRCCGARARVRRERLQGLLLPPGPSAMRLTEDLADARAVMRDLFGDLAPKKVIDAPPEPKDDK